jgi:transcriptional regulator with XRE-family HTH domain
MKNRIAQIRQLKGMSLTEVANAASTTKAQIQKLEKGERRLTLDWIERIARALGVSVVDLIPSVEVKSGAQKVDGQIMSMINMLSERDKRMLLDVAEGLFSRNAKR